MRYVLLWSWTEQGVRKVKDTVKRAQAARALAQKYGGKLELFYYTMGQYDGVAVAEAPDDATMSRIAIALSSLGNVRTTTLRAYTEAEMAQILSRI